MGDGYSSLGYGKWDQGYGTSTVFWESASDDDRAHRHGHRDDGLCNGEVLELLILPFRKYATHSMFHHVLIYACARTISLSSSYAVEKKNSQTTKVVSRFTLLISLRNHAVQQSDDGILRKK